MKQAIKIATGLLKKKIMLAILGVVGGSGFIIIAIFIIILMILFAVIGATENNTTQNADVDYEAEFGHQNLSAHVLELKDTVEKYAKEEGVEDHVPIILGIIQQESGGSPDINDPMQSSESLCGYIGCITDPDLSIKQGVSHFKKVLDEAGGDEKLAIQSYNFGSGFINYVKDKDGTYTFNKPLGDKQTYDLAISFSQEQYQKQVSNGNGSMFTCLRAEAEPFDACYGDILYVWSVMQYVTDDSSENNGGDGKNEGNKSSGDWLHGVEGHYEQTSPFGPRVHPITGEVGKMHNGVDFACKREHLPIVAVDDGVVIVSIFGESGSGYGGYGNTIVIKHSNNLYSLYGHLHERTAQVGEKVSRGDAIGTCGNTGASAGIHLHLEARTSLEGGQFDPMNLIENN